MISRSERPAFDAFVQASSNRLLRTAFLLCGDRGHAEDLVQTALMRTARHWRRSREAPEAYARRVVVNLAKDRWRHLGRRPPETELEIDVATADESQGGHDALVDAVRELAHGQRAVLVLRYFDGLSVEETADVLNCSTGTVKSQTSRALANLRAALTPAMEQTHAD